MKTWQKILVAFVGSGLIGAATYSASLFPNMAVVLSGLTMSIAAGMTMLIGWAPSE